MNADPSVTDRFGEGFAYACWRRHVVPWNDWSLTYFFAWQYLQGLRP